MSDVPGQPVPLAAGLPPIRVEPGVTPAWPLAHQRAWLQMCAANPRLFDGPIWSVTRWSPQELVVRLDRYQRLAIQSHADVGDLGVRHLGVKALTTHTPALGTGGEPRILLARRGNLTRFYPNLWEIAPAGGVHAHAPLTGQSVIDTVIAEAREELFLDCTPVRAAIRPIALLEDQAVRAVEIVVHLPVPAPAIPRNDPENWECTATRWLTRAECRDFAAGCAAEITPPTRAVLRWQGWA